MKAKEFAHQMEQLLALFHEYPDLEMSTLMAILRKQLRGHSSVQTEVTPPAKKSRDDVPASSDWIGPLEEQVTNVPTEQLETFIRKSIAWKKRDNLLEWAKKLNLHYSTRTTKDEFLNLIVTHFEMKRSHSLIRNYQPETFTL